MRVGIFPYLCIVIIKTTLDMKIKEISTYKCRFCAELENGQFVLSNGSMELLLCEKVESGMKVVKTDIVAGIMMRTESDFKWAVEHLSL